MKNQLAKVAAVRQLSKGTILINANCKTIRHERWLVLQRIKGIEPLENLRFSRPSSVL